MGKVNRAYNRMNKKVDRFVTHDGGLVNRHLELEVDTQWYIQGDVHLNAVSTDMWSLGLQEGVQRVLCVWRGTQG